MSENYGTCINCKRAISGTNVIIDGLTYRCRYCWEQPEADNQADHRAKSPKRVAEQQVEQAMEDLDLPASAYLHLPYRALDDIMDGLPPGRVAMLAAFSGGGKTAFVTSSVIRWVDQGIRVYCLPLESEPNEFRTHLACKQLDYHAGMVLTGKYKRSMPAEVWKEMRLHLRETMIAQTTGDMSERLYVSPVSAINEAELIKAAEHAASLNADVLIIDHIDQVAGGNGTNLHAESVKVVDTTLELAKHYKLRILATSQLNNEMLRGDRLGVYSPPQPQHVYMGGKKRQVATWFMGLYRPLKLDGSKDPAWSDTLKAARAGTIPAIDVLEPNCMGVSVMKHRLYGEQETKTCFLRVSHGRVEDMPEIDVGGALHGIRTNRDVA